ncbi:MAG TPA: GNAT family N-acetyltransferase [Candidatus Eisenbacteria bacterium]|nr:GNAT family N-acetyltransferase [Candidatus Eisenbacteria bacterium]
MTIRVDTIATTEAFEALAAEWDALHDRSASRSLFVSWGWLHAWWRQFHAGRSLFVLAARDEAGRLIGLAPFCLRLETFPIPHRAVRFLGTEKVSSDYLDILLEPGAERAAAAALWDALRRASGRWDLLRLGDLLANSAVVEHWIPLAERDRFSMRRTPAEHCPYMPLAEDGEGFRKSLGPAMRQNYRKKCARLDEVDVAFTTASRTDDLPAALERLYELHRMRWRSRNLPGNFEDPRVLAFHADLVSKLAPKGRMRVHELRSGARSIAALYEYEFKDVAFCYQTGFDPASPDERLPATKYSPGVVVIGRSMEAAIARGRREFDFLRGPERYKAEWTKSYRQTEMLVLAPGGHPVAQATLAAERMERWGKGIVKSLIGRKAPAPAAAPPAPPASEGE